MDMSPEEGKPGDQSLHLQAHKSKENLQTVRVPAAMDTFPRKASLEMWWNSPLASDLPQSRITNHAFINITISQRTFDVFLPLGTVPEEK